MAPTSAKELEKALTELRDHEHGDVLVDLASRTILDRAARSLSRPDAEPGVTNRLEEEAELESEARSTSIGDPFDIIEQGPKNREEAALLGAALALGISRRLEERQDERERRELISKMLDRLDWLAATTSIDPYQALAMGLEEDKADSVWSIIAQDLVNSSKSEGAKTPTDEARRQTRLLVRANALSHAPRSARTELAKKVLPEIEDISLRRVAIAALAGVDDTTHASQGSEAGNFSASALAAAAARAPKLEGELESRPWGTPIKIITAVTGILLIRWIVRAIARYLLGFRRTGTVTLSATTVALEYQTKLLGKIVRQGTTNYSLRSLRSGGHELRFPALHLLIGALLLVLGVAFGFNLFVEGIWSSYPALAIFGAAIIGGGILIDVLLEKLVPSKKGVCSFALDFGRRKFVVLRGVKKELSEQFARELELLVPPIKPKKS